MFNTLKRRYETLTGDQRVTVTSTLNGGIVVLFFILWLGGAAAADYYISESAGGWVAASPVFIMIFGGLSCLYQAWRPILTKLFRDDKPEEPLTKDPL